MLPEALAQARALFDDLTPLRSDCGLTCGGACCRPMEGENTGMLLFPGEEALYEGKKGYRVLDTEMGKLLICSGMCDRADRPLSCRLFPLLPVMRGGKIRAEMDERAQPVCPLMRYGRDGLLASFVEGVEAVGSGLWEDAAQAEFIMRLTEEQDQLRALRRTLAGR